MFAKITINAKNEQGKEVVLLLDKSVSFELFPSSEEKKKTFFYVSTLTGLYSVDDNDIDFANDIEEQIQEIIIDEMRIKEEAPFPIRKTGKCL